MLLECGRFIHSCLIWICLLACYPDPDHDGCRRSHGSSDDGDGRDEDDRAETDRLPDVQQPAEGGQQRHGEALQHAATARRHHRLIRPGLGQAADLRPPLLYRLLRE